MDRPQYWTVNTTLPPTAAVKGLKWLYDHYCRRMWTAVDQAIAQSINALPAESRACLHQTLSYEERKALRSDVLWLLIEQTGVTVDLELSHLDVLDQTTLIRASVRLEAIERVLQEQAQR